jgi:hypothetical protein
MFLSKYFRLFEIAETSIKKILKFKYLKQSSPNIISISIIILKLNLKVRRSIGNN